MSQKKENIKDLIFKIFRYSPDEQKGPFYSTYHYRINRPMTILECLLAIQDEQDGSLAFRYSCRSAVCGSCAMTINGAQTLACKTQVRDIPGQQILIEPLPNFLVFKDLVVDMEPFFSALKKIEPWLHAKETAPEKEWRVTPSENKKLDQYVNCILCAACYGACPVLDRDEKYLGPAAIARLFRFVEDPRDGRNMSGLKEYDNQNGVWGCDTVFRCIDVCPKNVRPADGIAGVRRKLLLSRVKRFFRLSG